MNEYSEHNVKKLRRTNKGRMIAGVCSGIGEYVGIDPNLIRVGLAIATLFGGAGVGLYAIGWLLLPDEERDTSIVQDLISKQQQQRNATDWTGEHKPQQ
ncbi:PspC domain-containing protein [Nonomuraea sp. NPDC003560]|uniref:PspC domain-containing protein n=1 Tax=Nonomuraea sp. NPDC003560 TaxID=3364341 RepID=UPI0036A45961